MALAEPTQPADEALPNDEPRENAADAAPDEIAAAALAEVQFLVGQRSGALLSADFARGELGYFDRRLVAYIDVLVVRGAPAIDWLLAKLPAAESAADALGIGLVLLESGDSRAIDGLLAVLAAGEPEPLVHGLQAALAWVGPSARCRD